MYKWYMHCIIYLNIWHSEWLGLNWGHTRTGVGVQCQVLAGVKRHGQEFQRMEVIAARRLATVEGASGITSRGGYQWAWSVSTS